MRFKVGDKVRIVRVSGTYNSGLQIKYGKWIGTSWTVQQVLERGYNLGLPESDYWSDDELELDKNTSILEIINAL